MPRNPRKPQAKKPPASKPSKKAPAKKPRAPTNRNTNSVRVHIINSSGGDSAPPPYAGPDRSSFVFNPVFDMGRPMAERMPPMNYAGPLSEPTASRVQAGAVNNPSMSTGSGFEVGESSNAPERRDPIDFLTLGELQDLASKLGVKYKRKSEARLREQLKKTIDERSRGST